MLDLEQIANNYQYSISAISALGTWAAIFVALWIALRSSKPRLKVFADKSVHIPSHAQTSGTVNWDLCEDMISVTMQNKGSVTIYINYWSFYWKLPWRWTVTAQQNPYYPNFKSEPIKLEPGQSASINLSNNIEGHKENLRNICSKNKVPYFMRRFVALKVFTSDGSVFKATFGKSYKKEFF